MQRTQRHSTLWYAFVIAIAVVLVTLVSVAQMPRNALGVESIFKPKSSQVSVQGSTLADSKENRGQDRAEQDPREDENKLLSDKVVTEDRKVLEDTAEALYTPPKGEVPKKRFPQAVIIGYAKCGTRALLQYINLHPYVEVCRDEMHFYDNDELFARGYQWYLGQMPLSYSNQITIEKTPAYVFTPRAVSEMTKHFPKVKVIVLVRNPVDQVLSQDAQEESRREEWKAFSEAPYYFTPQGSLDTKMFIVQSAAYNETLSPWLMSLPSDQILVLKGEELTGNPLIVLRKVESFLHLKPLFSERNFYYNATKGFYCLVPFGAGSKPACLGEGKGRPHRDISSKQLKTMYDFYRPYNEELFKLLGTRFDWETEVV